MARRWIGVLAAGITAAACAAEPASEPDITPSVPAVAEVAVRCEPSERMPLEGRASPYDSTAFTIAGAEALVCYGRPSARGREIFGGLVPYDTLWRTGANEPTIVHLPVAAEIAGVPVEPGSYSLYTVPGEEEWTIIVNRATSQWGHESAYTEEVRAQEVGRATVPSTRTEEFVEVFTIRSQPTGEGSDLVLEWENTRVRVPVVLVR